jgi:hypothetical protein
VDNRERATAITGKISANPNPIPLGRGCVVISWETNDPPEGKFVFQPRPVRKRWVSRGQSGQKEIPWIVDSTTYDFRLYAFSQHETPIDSVQVRRALDSDPMALRELADQALCGNIDMKELSRFIATIIPRCLRSGKFHEIFPVWERHGFHVTPVHFYQPIPDTQSLPQKLWDYPSELVGIDMNDSVQLDLLRNRFPKFRGEYEQFPTKPTGQPSRFHLNNDFFDGTDALVAYCMVRHFQPRLIIEVGSGFSSLIAAEAAAKNRSSALICIEPFPREFLRQRFPGLNSLIEKKVEDLDLDFFSQLGPGDILFIDSSHTVKIGGDVNYLFWKSCRVSSRG